MVCGHIAASLEHWLDPNAPVLQLLWKYENTGDNSATRGGRRRSDRPLLKQLLVRGRTAGQSDLIAFRELGEHPPELAGIARHRTAWTLKCPFWPLWSSAIGWGLLAVAFAILVFGAFQVLGFLQPHTTTL
jgi:hypothetical protein